MKKELRSSIAFRIARNTLSASAFAFISFVGMAQAQAVEIPTNAIKQTAPEGQTERVVAGDNTKKEDAASIVGLPGVRLDGPMIARSGSADDRPGFGSSSTPTKPYNKSSFVSGWDFAFTPYLYMTGLTGTVGARGRTAGRATVGAWGDRPVDPTTSFSPRAPPRGEGARRGGEGPRLRQRNGPWASPLTIFPG